MNVRVFGFNFDPKDMPKAMTSPLVFDFMSTHTGEKLGKAYQYGCTKVTLPHGGKTQEWWAGMLLRIRDSKAYMKLTEVEGKSVLTAENLGENEKLAELSFFIAHPETGSGLYTHHYQAASLYAFGNVARRLFNNLRREMKNATLAQAKLLGDDPKEIRQQFHGQLTLGQLCFDTNLKELVRHLEKVSSFEFKFSTVKTTERFLRGIAARAKSERIKFTFPPDADVADLADQVDQAAKIDDMTEMKVTGTDTAGRSREYRLEHNPLVFDEYDYDSMMTGLKLDLSDWPASIKKASAIAHLGKVASNVKVMQLLTKA